MSFIAGDIMIRMAADVASLRTDMDNAKRSVSGAVDQMKTALSTLGAAISVGGLTAWAKSAIDVADKADEMSQRVGMSVEEISRLSLAFQMGGVDAGGLQTALTKLSKNVIENEGAFKALGVSVKNSDGAYRSSADILADVSDFFSKMPDGVTKTALATELFGKAGADLIPVLNGGKKGLADMSDEADRFGTVISNEAGAAAGAFNDALDLLRKRAEAATVNGLAPILPVLTEIIRQFGQIGNATKDATGEIGPWQSAFMTASEAVSVLLLNVVYVARAVGGEVMTIGKQLAALATLDFAEFTRLSDEWKTKSAQMRQEVDDQSAAILNARNQVKAHGEELETAKPKIDSNANAMAQAALKAKDLEAEQKKAADAAKKHSEEMDRLAESIRMENAGLSADFLRKLQQLTELRDTNRISVEEYEKALQALVEKQPVVKAQMEAERKELELLASRQLESIKNYEAQEQKMDAALKSAEDLIGGIQRETSALTMSNTEREISNALLALEKSGLEKGTYAYEVYAEKIKAAVLDREAVRESIEKTKEIEAEWKKATDNITNGLTDALMRGFESGKGFAENIKDYIKNAFKTLVADFVIRPVMAPISGALASLFSGNAMAGTGGAGGGLGSLLSSGMNLLNGGAMNGIGLNIVNSGLGQSLGLSSLQNIGGNMIAGPTGLGSLVGSGLGMLGNGFMGYGISKALSGGYSAGGGINAIAGLASAIPGIGPIAGVVGGLVNRAFGMKAKEMKDFGITGTITGGDATGQRFQDWFQKGGWFRSNKSGTEYSDLGSDLSAALDFGAKQVLDQTKTWAEVLKLPAQSLSNVSANFRIKLTDDEKANKDAIELVFKGYSDALTQQFEASIAPFRKAGESIADAMARLASLSIFSDSINQLGGVFSRIASSSIGAKENIIALAGGIDQLMAKAGQFAKDYYTQGEQAGLQARDVLSLFRELGINGGWVTSRQDFRGLVESVDVNSEQGQRQLVALLDIAPSFASLADYLKEQGATLEQVAQQAPVVSVLDRMLPEQQSTTQAVSNVAVQIQEGNAILGQVVTAIESGTSATNTILTAIAAVQETIAQLQTAANGIATQTAQAVGDLAGSQSLSRAAPSYTYDIGSTN